MDLQLEIRAIKKELDEVTDESLVEAIKRILASARIQKYELGLKPMSIEEYRARAEESEKDIKLGRVIPAEQLESESENW